MIKIINIDYMAIIAIVAHPPILNLKPFFMGILNDWFLLHIWSRQRGPKMVMSYFFFYNLYMQCGNSWSISFKVEVKTKLDEGQKPMAKW